MATTAKTMLMILSFLIFSLNTIVSNKKFVQIESGGPNTDEKSKSTLPTIIKDTRVEKLDVRVATATSNALFLYFKIFLYVLLSNKLFLCMSTTKGIRNTFV